MKEDTIRISAAEWEVMRVLWNAKEAVPASEIIRTLAPNSSWKPKTVRTFLNRLVAKKALQCVKKEQENGQELLHYEPLLDEATTLRLEQETFLDRYFGGTVRSMLSCCIEMGDVPTEELEEMRDMIERQVALQKKLQAEKEESDAP